MRVGGLRPRVGAGRKGKRGEQWHPVDGCGEWLVLVGLLGALALPSAAQAAIPNIPDGAGGNITCTVQTGANAGQRRCSGIFTTFDGAPIDINVGFPPAPASGPDGNFPIVGVFHGWGGSKLARHRGRLDQRRLRLLLDERPRLGQLVRRHRPEAHPARVRRTATTT